MFYFFNIGIKKIFKNYVLKIVCLCVVCHVSAGSLEVREGVACCGAGVTGGCASPVQVLEASHPLQKQYTVPTAEPSRQLKNQHFK